MMMDDFALNQLTMLDTTCEETTILEDLKDVIQQMLSNIQDEVKKVILAALLLAISAPTTPVYANVETVMEYSIAQESIYDIYLDRLEGMRTLEEDWDYEGASPVNPDAISNSEQLIEMLPVSVLESNLKVFPTELGAVAFKLKTNVGFIRGEIGIDNFSYFVRRDKHSSEHHSFEPWDREYIQRLVSSFESII